MYEALCALVRTKLFSCKEILNIKYYGRFFWHNFKEELRS